MNDYMIDNWMVSMDAWPSQRLQRKFPTTTCFLTNLTLLSFLTFLTNDLPFFRYLAVRNVRSTVRNVRLSDKSDCACGEKSNFLSLFLACPPRARAIRFVRRLPAMILRTW